MSFVLSHCGNCGTRFDTSSVPSNCSPHALPCGHVLCLTCAKKPTLTPATSMSVCHQCHVAYTIRDVYPLKLAPYLSKKQPRWKHSTRQPSVTPTGDPGNTDSQEYWFPGPYAQTSPSGEEMTVPALLQRIRDLEAAVAHRDSQIHEWRRQFDKNAQSLLLYIRETRDLKQEVLDWWRKFHTKDLELQAARRTLSIASPTKTVQVRTPPASPPRNTPLDGTRIVRREMTPLQLMFKETTIPPP